MAASMESFSPLKRSQREFASLSTMQAKADYVAHCLFFDIKNCPGWMPEGQHRNMQRLTSGLKKLPLLRDKLFGPFYFEAAVYWRDLRSINVELSFDRGFKDLSYEGYDVGPNGQKDDYGNMQYAIAYNYFAMSNGSFCLAADLAKRIVPTLEPEADDTLTALCKKGDVIEAAWGVARGGEFLDVHDMYENEYWIRLIQPFPGDAFNAVDLFFKMLNDEGGRLKRDNQWVAPRLNRSSSKRRRDSLGLNLLSWLEGFPRRKHHPMRDLSRAERQGDEACSSIGDEFFAGRGASEY